MQRKEPRRLPLLLYIALAHHSEFRLNRTLVVGIFGWRQPFCTRCSFQWSTCAISTVAAQFIPVELGIVAWTVILSLLPFPALVDWVTQTWGFRESTTLIRAATGTLLGVGFGFELLAVLHLDYVRILIGAGIYGVYTLIIVALFATKRIPFTYFEDLEKAFPKALGRDSSATWNVSKPPDGNV